MTLFFLAAGCISTVALAASGVLTPSVFALLLWCLPALLIGSMLGVVLYRRLGVHDYRRLVFSLLLAMALVLIWRALAGLGR
ncbi:MAG: hypothetical protein C1943_14880 [Halochromatium sp.]|nr:hypothetical protein [Halochromatium sp.]